MKGMQTRIIFMGSPDFAVPALRLLAVKYPIVGVVTQPDRPAGRGRKLLAPPVKVAALELGLPVLQTEKIRQPEVFQQLSSLKPDVIIVAAFGQILRQHVLDLAPFGCANIHASLLPRWRGAAPIQACILAGDAQTGISIMKLDAGVDTGPILSQRSITIDAEATGGSLFEKLATLGGELLMDTLPDYLSGKIKPQPQDGANSTYAPMLKKEDGLLDLSLPAESLARRVRAFNPWPGTYFLMNGLTIKILAAHSQAGESVPGRRSIIDEKPAISTSDGVLVLDEVQPSGKRSMPGKAYLSGARDWLDQGSINKEV
jgi:methionyl-tRNA formyltransferase